MLSLAGGLVHGSRADELVRTPYLQSATPDSIVIRWRTKTENLGSVRYGSEPNNLGNSVTEPVPTREHVLQLAHLAPSTTYFYSVGTSAETLAKGADCQFVTPPPPGQPKPTRIWVIGDSGVFNSGYGDVISVRDAYYGFTRKHKTDLWLALGDNAYLDGTDQEYQENFFEVFPWLLRQSPVWTTIGNHETYSSDAAGWFPYLDMFTLPTAAEAGGTASGTRRYYSFDYANIHFVSLDSMTQSRGSNAPMANWLRADLAATTSPWIIAFWHHPPYSMGSHNSDYEYELIQMRENILPILEARGVDLVLSGHSHNYERSFLLRGHYGKSSTLLPEMILDRGSGRERETGAYIKPLSGPLANQGTVYIVNGSGGDAEDRDGHHPAMFMDEKQMGSLVVDVNSNRMDIAFLTRNSTIADSFSIIKADPEPLRLCSFNLRNGQTLARWKSIRGRNYRVEQTEALGSGNWQPVGDPVVATGATTFWTNSAPQNGVWRFYRVTEGVSPHF